MKISVLITVHNRFELLRRNLLSLRHQSVSPHEVIVSDDGSEENILAPLRQIALQAPFKIKYVRQPHKGFRAAKVRNNAARFADGDLFVFLDQDIIGTKGFLQTFSRDAAADEFRVSWPIRLAERQTADLSDDVVISGDFTSLLSKEQMREIARQYRKDLFYRWMHSLHLRKIGPKLRSGLFSVFRESYFKVNGFDEMYRGWGNEDDDLGRRLYAAGVRGRNPFLREFPLHLFHPPNRRGRDRPNLQYYQKRIPEIHRGDYRCRYGVENPLEKENLQKLELN